MNIDDIKKQIKKYGKTVYIAEKGTPIQKKFDPIKKELNLLLPGPTPISIFEKPLSLIGTVSHQLAGEEWPSIEGKFCMPLLQITKDLPIFQKLFGLENQLITIYFPQEAVYLEKENRWAINIKEYVISEAERMIKVTIPKGVPQEKMIHVIKWKKTIEYPSSDLFELFYPQELIESIKQIEEIYGSDFYEENFPTSERTKIGGYPFCIQSEPHRWLSRPLKADHNVLDWEFILQISQDDFEKLRLVDQGIMAIFHHKHTKEWVGELQYF